MILSMSEQVVYITEAAELLDRRPGTLRKWEREGRLPEDLLPKRDERQHRYWTEKQIELIKSWMYEVDLRPGKGLPHNTKQPDPERVREHLRKLRQPRL